MTYKEQREQEKARYIEVNRSRFPDVYQRWRDYEDTILTKFGKGLEFPRHTRSHALDLAWAKRDRHNTWASNKGTRLAPISEHGK
jgi:hypothetical protein